jgi:hypothetical protein
MIASDSFVVAPLGAGKLAIEALFQMFFIVVAFMKNAVPSKIC